MDIYRMNKMIFILAQMLIIGTCSGAPTALKCNQVGSPSTWDLVIDIEKRTLLLGGIFRFTIHTMNDRYISAYRDADSVIDAGGETIVFVKATGEYLRAAVDLVWDSPAAMERRAAGKLSADTYRGKCFRPVM